MESGSVEEFLKVIGGGLTAAGLLATVAVYVLKDSYRATMDLLTRNREIAMQLRSTLEAKKFDYTLGVDTNLRDRRVECYADLWRITGTLPRYPPRTDLTFKDLKTMSERLQAWYFGTEEGQDPKSPGGVFLSQSSYDQYMALQKLIGQALAEHPDRAQSLATEYEAIRLECSQLRRELREDVNGLREQRHLDR